MNNFIYYFRIPASFHTTNISSHQIPLKFPSNHPYSSHISEKALFPNASINLDDRPSTDIDPYIVTHKIRGKTIFKDYFMSILFIKKR
jgi:hypothetical protein